MILLALAACARRDDLAELRSRIGAAVAEQRPCVAALVLRLARVKDQLRGNRPGWETELRVAELANDELGLPPFTQEVPPGPEWRPSPTSLLGIDPYVVRRASELTNREALQFLYDDTRARYARGTAEVDARLAELEAWLATAPP
ncbi:MAG TPA: hypothetical protein VLT45_29820 [Kofleriaceae bacterium]|nr:hypothetical protein [Kofleriaceae bacterium]